MRKKLFLLLIALGLVLAGCGGGGEEDYTLGEITLSEEFTSSAAWETYVEGDTEMRVDDSVYRIQTGAGGYVWGLNSQEHSNIVLEVTTEQRSAFENNAYGIMCRADTSNNGDGYYFLISGDGYYAISRGEGDDVTPVVDWTESGAINQGAGSNTLRAVCIDDYLALYVNGAFLTQTRDSAYDSGYAGFAAAAFEGGDIDVTFDDLTIWQARLGAAE